MKKISNDTRRNLQVSSVVIGFVTMLLMAVWSGQASAANINKRIIDGIWHITYDGRVEEGDVAKLTTIIEANPDIEWISMNSGGGDGYEGDLLNDVIYEFAMSTRVRAGNECMSACANAFIGGHQLAVEGTLGFHSFRYPQYDGNGKMRVDRQDVRNSVYYAQYGASYDIYKMMLNGFSWDLHFNYTDKEGEFLEFKSNEELQVYYLGPIDFSTGFLDQRDVKNFYYFN